MAQPDNDSRTPDWRLKMSQFYEDTVQNEDHRPCAGLRQELKFCLQESDCVKKNHKTPRECLKVDDGSVPQDCIILRQTFFECKRALLDTRQRFRGRKGY
ncbi:Cytochrome c oxidase assembly factor 5 [Orchesella cincta]|uniref:Cytochrome c oxidase assembly factor 5 n=1 Tax=Orchesella cincta TaxID=48709 RepID=A0A1D2N9M7_ORCCI|nr:Cytochrome c oxidase assembly factor 5 [Orchesella cincta]